MEKIPPVYPPKSNMEPENHPFEKENHLPNLHGFGFKMLVFRGFSTKKKKMKLNSLDPQACGKFELLRPFRLRRFEVVPRLWRFGLGSSGSQFFMGSVVMAAARGFFDIKNM